MPSPDPYTVVRRQKYTPPHSCWKETLPDHETTQHFTPGDRVRCDVCGRISVLRCTADGSRWWARETRLGTWLRDMRDDGAGAPFVLCMASSAVVAALGVMAVFS